MTVEQAAARSTVRIDVAYIGCKGVFSGSAEVAAGLSSPPTPPVGVLGNKGNMVKTHMVKLDRI